ncbi:DUF418 domain-containing protein [Streptomyces sp. SP18BB07]|uniref:DUF418 domain-containing protein n=1 Tax=Streptomyces sp. SP18BB07 TaxID=3002522 RepID=UPI002E79C94E|nr:DUF418 domain-containing protein [Streptomyces sp. SP18BB07]MEE1759565.1 DUF418 domain-containing protein [Streptomyces sp. SP18BB07]
MLRGIAIIGTLLSNIGTFVALSEDEVPVYILGARAEMYVDQLAFMVANGKFLALLSILFGVGMAIQCESALRHGRRWPWRYEWRSLLLLVDGFIHFALVVDFDVLMGYALVAMVVAPLLLLRTRWLVAAAVLAGSVHMTMQFRELLTGVTFGASSQDDFVSATYFGEVAHRVTNFWEIRQGLLVFSAPLTAFLFLSGALLWRAGLFRGDARAHVLSRRLAVGGLVVGMPLTVWVILPLPGQEYFVSLFRYTSAPIVAFGYLGLILVLLRRRGGSGFFGRRLAEVGRTALSCYMLQNVVAIMAFTEGGLDVGAFGPVGTVLAWAVISALLMLFAWWWLRHFRQGPFEGVWRWAVDAPFRRVDQKRREERDGDAKRAGAENGAVVGAS